MNHYRNIINTVLTYTLAVLALTTVILTAALFVWHGIRALHALLVLTPGYILAAVALLNGLFLLAYSTKYYLVSILILAISGDSGLANRNGKSPGLYNACNNGQENGFHVRLDHHPFVSVHLALYNEARVVNRLLEACTAFNYDAYEVIVVDDSTDHTPELLKAWSNHPRVKVIHRDNRRGFKGGALQVALEQTDPRAEFVMVFDADFIPSPESIWQFLAYFYGIDGNGPAENNGAYLDERVAVVQGYQRLVLNGNENWVTRSVRAGFAGSYIIERPAQEFYRGLKMVAGSVFMVRSDVLRELGWTTSITEDWELTLRLYSNGYKVLYTPYVQAPGECPATLTALCRQQMRWAEGHIHAARNHFWKVLSSSKMRFREKLEFLWYMPYFLQAVFLMLGTTCWLVAELLLHMTLPGWIASVGWGLLVFNGGALPAMLLAGLFPEGEVQEYVDGALAILVLVYLLAPLIGFASLKGLLERQDGGWHRTPKSGKITEVLRRFRLRRRFDWLLPKRRHVAHRDMAQHQQ